MPKISVIMSAYNEPEQYLRASIESILNQSFNDFEFIIIIDNPRNQQISNVIEEYANKDNRIRVIRNASNLGLTSSLNKGLECCSGEIIVRMDADDISDLKRIEKQLNFLNENRLDLIGTSMRRISENGETVSELTNKAYPYECIMRLLDYDDCVPHPTWMVRRRVYKQLHGYREIHACEDYDFLLRAKKMKYRIGICGDVLLHYRVNTHGISRQNSLKQMLSSSFLRKNYQRLETIDPQEIENYLSRFLTDESQVKYEEGLLLLNKGIDSLKNGKVEGVIQIIQAAIKSKYVLDNIKRIIIMMFIKCKYR